MKNSRKAVLLAALLASAPATFAQAVIFPQTQQGETASLVYDDVAGQYVLSNELFSAAFITDGAGHLSFNGAEELGLKPGTPLFTLILGDGTTVSSDDLVPSSVEITDLGVDNTAARAALKIPGKAVVAKYTVNDHLDLTWRGVLRDGSHYLRTELELTANGADVAMRQITPMLYTVDATAVGTPRVVGNTRGAVILADKIFAGLETPMAYNSVISSSQVAYGPMENPKAWTPEIFSHTFGDKCPAELINKTISNGGVSYTTDAAHIVGDCGYVFFTEPGETTFEFLYASGSHRLNLMGVDILDPVTETVVASDYHWGFTGGAKQDNVFTLNIPKAQAYVLRYFVENVSETITSSGNINISKPVGVPTEVLVDLAPGSTPTWSEVTTADLNYTGSDFTTASAATWTATTLPVCPEAVIPQAISDLVANKSHILYKDVNFTAPAKGEVSVTVIYQTGSHRVDMQGAFLYDATQPIEAGNSVSNDVHFGFSGTNKVDNTYTMSVPAAGDYTIRVFYDTTNESLNSTGKIDLAFTDSGRPEMLVHLAASDTQQIQGVWSRNTTLKQDKTWRVGTVVGLVVPDQARRSFLAYSERERAVPWRAMPAYISWYELNINRNNAQNYTGNMTEDQCEEVMQHWKTDFYDKYGETPAAFVWDDGWDTYGTWTFSPNFPNGFTKPATIAESMGAGTGCWLGPVGGYGQSGNYRHSYWSDKGGMQLSNPAYYQVFLDAVSNFTRDYDFRFFKFDGISAQFSATGPDAGDTGNENAEAIIDIEQRVREIKPDLFLNTTVGTWASPFWFQYTDAVWRQEQDFGTIGNNSIPRENWITYRDRLVYQNFVQNSPICPINTLMTHGFILSKYGNVSPYAVTSAYNTYDAIVREMRMAFACGSGMVEIYADFDLMNSIVGNNGEAGALWGELAKCMKWQREQADVLPDIHWVGGNPWTGGKAEVYGWGAWNAKKATLTLRNGANNAQQFKTTLREALDIPADVNTSIMLSHAFDDQADITGLDMTQPVDIDTPLTLTLPASSVYVLNGEDKNPGDYTATGIRDIVDDVTVESPAASGIYDLQGRRLAAPVRGAVNIINGVKTLVK